MWRRIWESVVSLFSKKFVCPIDGKKFKTQAQLDVHMKAQHPTRVPINIAWS